MPLPAVVQSEIVPVVSCFPSSRASPLRNRLPVGPCHVADGGNPQLPFWFLVSFGAYILFRLGWGVLTFHDVPEAHEELMAEIEEAKKELRKLGVGVD